MTKELLTPDYIFEASWEVCNNVGGIYTVSVSYTHLDVYKRQVCAP